MTEDRILTDREKLELWDVICLQNGWAVVNEIDKWLNKHGIYFTSAGSCINLGPYMFKLENEPNAKVIANGSTIDELVTFVLQALCGMLTFADVELEGKFWKLMRERFLLEFKQDIPVEIVPKYHRELVFTNKKSDDTGVNPDFSNPEDNNPSDTDKDS